MIFRTNKGCPGFLLVEAILLLQLAACGPDLKSMSHGELTERAEEAVVFGDYKDASKYFEEIDNRGTDFLVLYQMGVSNNKIKKHKEAILNLHSAIAAWEQHCQENLIPDDKIDEFKVACYSELQISYEGLELLNRSHDGDTKKNEIEIKLANVGAIRDSLKNRLTYWGEHPELVKKNYEKRLLNKAIKNPGHIQVGWSSNNVKAIMGDPDIKEFVGVDFVIGGSAMRWVYFSETEFSYISQGSDGPTNFYFPDYMNIPSVHYVPETYDLNTNTYNGGYRVDTYTPSSRIIRSSGERTPGKSETIILKTTIEIFFDSEGIVESWTEQRDGYRFGDKTAKATGEVPISR